MANKGAPTVCSPQVKGKMRRKHPGGGMHHRCTLAGLPASMAFRWRKSPCRPSLSQKNTASRGRMGQICGKSKKSEQVQAGAWGTGGNADNGSGGCGYIAWPGAGRAPGLPPPVAARRVGIAAPKPVWLPSGSELLRRNSFGCQAGRNCSTETRLAAVRPAKTAPGRARLSVSSSTKLIRGQRRRCGDTGRAGTSAGWSYPPKESRATGQLGMNLFSRLSSRASASTAR